MSEPTMIRAASMPAVDDHSIWPSVTNVPCPWCKTGTIRWAEDGFVPGYRICDGCGQHALVKGTTQRPVLAPMVEVASRSFDGAEEGQDVPAGRPYRFHPNTRKNP